MTFFCQISNKRVIPSQSDNDFLDPNLVINEYKQNTFFGVYIVVF